MRRPCPLGDLFRDTHARVRAILFTHTLFAYASSMNPFLNPDQAMLSDSERTFEELNGAYNAAAMSHEKSRIIEVLGRPISPVIRERPDLHGLIRRRRGNMFSSIGEYTAAEQEYGLGFYDSPVPAKGDYLLDWAMSAFTLLFLKTTQPGEKNAAAQRCMDILGMADGFAHKVRDSRYLLASTSYVRAFLLVRAGEKSAARDQLARPELGALPPAFREDDSLAQFFTQLPKGLFAALELKDAELLCKLTQAILSKDEAAAVGDGTFSAGELFMFMLGVRLDVPKFRDSWTALLEFIHMLFPAFPITRRFRRILMGNEHLDPAEFIDVLC